MQTLYEWDFRGSRHGKVDIDSILERNLKEFGPGLEEKEFSRQLIHGVLEKHDALNELITKAAPEWPLSQIAIVDRNILRIGLWELIFGNYKEVPPKVAINEAIELAKTFGGEKSGKFINGVVGTVYREMGEPGKDAHAKKGLTAEEIKKLPCDDKVGGVVYRKEKDQFLFALVLDVFGYWTLSKGGIGKDENPSGVVKRELSKELGITHLVVKKELGANEYVAHDPERGPIRKRVAYFLVETTDKVLKLKQSGGLVQAQWLSESELLNIKTYPDIKKIFQAALTVLQQQT
ncbi:MAG: transcription antitermination factor NusB [Candidatus Ryanbacteria bacterium RIFCSPLOWO2_12_FULL_44_26]|nr:MAG: transcription antitermination factor NusB [Candidatus Ryanbacteria bacterium RIFCSPLOWO2_12_FULL_44_26]